MADLRQQYHDYNPRSTETRDILKELDSLIGDRYNVINETSLKNDFLVACFERIDPNQSWEDLVKTHENYDQSWTPKKKRATALRQLMTKQIGWPEDKGLLGFKRKYLAGILLAIKASDEGISQSEDHTTVTLQPDFNLELLAKELPERTLPELDFPTLLTFSNTVEPDATALLQERGIEPTSNSHHVVYVIDCTPEAENERAAISSIRQDAQAKSSSGNALSDREAAAVFLNESKGILYVGYSHEFPRRMKRHHQGKASGAADFINLYKPRRLLEVTAYDSEGEARNRERIRANELRRETDCYVYQN